MAILKLEGAKFRAFHGCLPEENILGGNFQIDVWIDFDSTHAENSDDLTNTIDYADIYHIAKTEMEIKSNLIENVCKRIPQKILAKWNAINAGEVTLTKFNPPIDGIVNSVSISTKLK